MPYPAGEPQWQVDILNQLSSQGKLSGVNPLILAGIGQEESGWEVAGAGYNSAGYGGYFGLGAHTYAGGNTETVSELLTNSPASFTHQAITAAAAFNSYMQEAVSQGYSDVVGRAETIYQEGGGSTGIESGGGVAVVKQALGQASAGGGGTYSGGGAAATTAATGTTAGFNPLDPFGLWGKVSQAGGGAIASGITGVISAFIEPLKKWLTDAFLIVFGVVVIVIGLVIVVHASGKESVLPQPSSSSDEEGEEEGEAGGGHEEERSEEPAPAPSRSSSTRSSSTRGSGRSSPASSGRPKGSITRGGTEGMEGSAARVGGTAEDVAAAA